MRPLPHRRPRRQGFVDIQEVMLTSNAGKKEAEDLKKSVDKNKVTHPGKRRRAEETQG
ncbi:MAG: hypothetical protein MZV70_48595 [Desulfobacterales bacterium]|nr:hypothetical protein [Desulfobacterales bacterium]